ncbi:hypothetical protein Hanom_Chr11g01049901 [Helianthus anomalus]
MPRRLAAEPLPPQAKPLRRTPDLCRFEDCQAEPLHVKAEPLYPIPSLYNLNLSRYTSKPL